MTRPQLYPSHQHQWTDEDMPVNVQGHVHSEPICAWPECETYLTPEQMQERRTQVRCTVCGFTAPRTLAGLDGRPAEPPPDAHEWGLDDWRAWGAGRSDTDTRCTHQDAAGQCLDHQGHAGDHQYPQPEQEKTADA